VDRTPSPAVFGFRSTPPISKLGGAPPFLESRLPSHRVAADDRAKNPKLRRTACAIESGTPTSMLAASIVRPLAADPSIVTELRISGSCSQA
jgi:hypothetical protein